MKKHTVQQELLLVTNSTFSQRHLCEKDTAERHKQLSQAELLEEACWNGLLNELLPEIMERSSSGNWLYLWHIWQKQSLLQLELGECPVSIEKEHSIVTSFFMQTVVFN